jgi:hypothetical protein
MDDTDIFVPVLRWSCEVLERRTSALLVKFVDIVNPDNSVLVAEIPHANLTSTEVTKMVKGTKFELAFGLRNMGHIRSMIHTIKFFDTKDDNIKNRESAVIAFDAFIHYVAN